MIEISEQSASVAVFAPGFKVSEQSASIALFHPGLKVSEQSVCIAVFPPPPPPQPWPPGHPAPAGSTRAGSAPMAGGGVCIAVGTALAGLGVLGAAYSTSAPAGVGSARAALVVAGVGASYRNAAAGSASASMSTSGVSDASAAPGAASAAFTAAATGASYRGATTGAASAALSAIAYALTFHTAAQGSAYAYLDANAVSDGEINTIGVGSASATMTPVGVLNQTKRTAGSAAAGMVATCNNTSIDPAAGSASGALTSDAVAGQYTATRATAGTASAQILAAGVGLGFRRVGAGTAVASFSAAGVLNFFSSIGKGTMTATLTATSTSTKVNHGDGAAHATLTTSGTGSMTSSIGAGSASAALGAEAGGAYYLYTNGSPPQAVLSQDQLIASTGLIYTGGKAVSVISGAAFSAVPIGTVSVLIADRIAIHLSGVAIWYMKLSMFSGVTLRDKIQHIIRVSMAETIHFHSTWVYQITIQILEHLHLIDHHGAAGHFSMAVDDDMTLGAALQAAFGKHIHDAVQFAAELTPLYHAIASVVEDIEFEDTHQTKWILSGVVDEEIAIGETFSPKMFFNATITELLCVEGGMATPDGNLSVWQMNTRTGAVTEYGNYPFNSFGRLGLKQYIGATDDGLYQLDGDDDDGDPIIAAIRGGWVKFGGTHLSRIKAAYIAIRGSGKFLLKLVTGPGQEYIYEADAQNLETTKFWMGKGQRATYFAFELISTGQDFDLDTIEFVPIAVQRRV